MKVGDRVTTESSDHVFKIKSIDTDGLIATCVSVYNARTEKFRLTSLVKTVKNPAVLVETYGQDWKDNVNKALSAAKVKYKAFPVERSRDIHRFFVDAKKITVAKSILDEYYKKDLEEPHENKVDDNF